MLGEKCVESPPRNECVEQLREEAERFSAETGRQVNIQEEFVENSDGTRTHKFVWSVRKTSAREAVALVLKFGATPVREEDGVVRLRIPFAEQPAGSKGCIEQESWPIRSPETASLIASILFDAGSDGVTPRELREVALILEGQALRTQTVVEAPEAAERISILGAVIRLMEICRTVYRGTASELLATLNSLSEVEDLGWDKFPDWPQDARSLSAQLTRAEKWFAEAGIDYSYNRSASRRQHEFHWLPGQEPPLEASPGKDRSFGGPFPSRPLAADDANGDVSERMPEITEEMVRQSFARRQIAAEMRRMTQNDAGIGDFLRDEIAAAVVTPEPEAHSSPLAFSTEQNVTSPLPFDPILPTPSVAGGDWGFTSALQPRPLVDGHSLGEGCRARANCGNRTKFEELPMTQNDAANRDSGGDARADSRVAHVLEKRN